MTSSGEGGPCGYHVPVMRDEVLWLLRPTAGGTYVDCTLGGGGHAEAVLERITPGGLLLGIDRDGEAIASARHRLSSYESAGSFMAACGNFGNLDALAAERGVRCADGVLFDLGASSHQFDDPDRGFSYMDDAPLDMRMSADSGPSARDLVNTLPCNEIARILREYGEERWAPRIARFIVDRRDSNPITSTGQLVEIIKRAVPAAARRSGPHPARRTFQALRIAVNDELGNVEKGLDHAVDLVRAGGRIVVISFHSLEDRLVKRRFARDGGRLRILTRKPITPGDDEVKANPRARSAKLRAAERF